MSDEDFKRLLVVHCPKEIPDWFIHNSEPKPNSPVVKHPSCILRASINRHLSFIEANPEPAERNLDISINDLVKFEGLDREKTEKFVAKTMKQAEEYRLALLEWRNKDLFNRISQWPWFYACIIMNSNVKSPKN